MWTNLGDWSATRRYADAARALAERVGTAAALRASDTVVDYACGFGDSLRLWVERFGVRRAIGIEPDPDICRVVRKRIVAWGMADRIEIREGRAEDLAPRAVDTDASAVVCVDAAYHFRTRERWWQLVADDLPPGGRIATADVLLSTAHRVRLPTRLCAAAMGIPAANLYDAPALTAKLAALPLRDLRIESCGVVVLDGFAQQAAAPAIAVRVTRAALRWLRAQGAVDYVIAAATRR